MTAAQLLVKLNSVTRLVLRKEKKRGDINILFLSAAKMQALNKKYRRKNKPTDVLSFPAAEKNYLGEIFICPEVARQQAKDFGDSLLHEMTRLTIHGTLHLLGYDHHTAADAARMLPRENKYLAASKL